MYSKTNEPSDLDYSNRGRQVLSLNTPLTFLTSENDIYTSCLRYYRSYLQSVTKHLYPSIYFYPGSLSLVKTRQN
jgi:hypothetical protein